MSFSYPTPQDYGAAGDGVQDDASAFNDAIADGADLYIPPGTYRIASTLEIDVEGTRWRGAGGGPSSDAGLRSWFVYDGTGDVGIQVTARDVNLSSFGLRVDPDRSLIAGIYIDKGAGTVTGWRFADLWIRGKQDDGDGLRGPITYSVMVGDADDTLELGASDNLNLEYGVHDRCAFGPCETAAYYINNTTAQSRHHSFSRCGFLGKGTTQALATAAGIRTRSGHFIAERCSFKRLVTCVELGSITDTPVLRDTDYESCRRLLDTAWLGGATSGWGGIVIDGGRFKQDRWYEEADANGDAAFWIRYSNRGPLALRSLGIDEHTPTFTAERRARWQISAGGFGTTIVDAHSCVFPNDAPIRPRGASTITRRLIGCGGRDTNGQRTVLDDETLTVDDPVAPTLVELTGLRDIYTGGDWRVRLGVALQDVQPQDLTALLTGATATCVLERDAAPPFRGVTQVAVGATLDAPSQSALLTLTAAETAGLAVGTWYVRMTVQTAAGSTLRVRTGFLDVRDRI